MTSPIEETFKRARESQERQTRQIQSGQIVAIDRSTLPWTVTVEFTTAHHESYRVEGISLDPIISFPDAGGIFVLPRNDGDGASLGANPPVVAVEVSRGESDEAASITGYHADYDLTLSGILARVAFAGGKITYADMDILGGPLYQISPVELEWAPDDPSAGRRVTGSVQPGDGSVNLGGKEINLFAAKPGDITETAIRVWIEGEADGGRVNIMYGADETTDINLLHVADLPLVHPSAVNVNTGKIRTEPAAPSATNGPSRAQSGNAPGPAGHEHDIPHFHQMAEHYHEVAILAVKPIRIWYQA